MVKIKYNIRITQLLVYTLIVLLSINPAVAQYDWYGFQQNGDAIHPEWAYNSMVATGTVSGSVYINYGHGVNYPRPS